MDGTFNIRLKPLLGESLSGYLMRAAQENGVHIGDILGHIFDRKLGLTSYNERAYCLDNIPLDILYRLTALTGKDVRTLEDMTLLPLYYKFFERGGRSLSDCRLLRNEIIKDKRRFCKSCIREYGYYKLIWQVKSVEMCDIHLTRLTTKCSNCGKEQPYICDELTRFKCIQCGSYLYKENDEIFIDEVEVSRLKKVSKNWNYLLDSNVSICNYIKEMSKERSLAIKVLYASQYGNDYFDIDMAKYYLNYKEVNRTFSFIFNNEDYEGYITVQKLFKILDALNLSIEDFAKINTTKEFVESLITFYKEQYKGKEEVGQCQSPWCISYGSSDKMERITHSRLDSNRYSFVHICTGCYIKYGYNKQSGTWESTDNFVDTVWHKVLPLINLGMKRRTIIEHTKLSFDTVYKAFGYIASHSLASNEIIEKYMPKQIPSDILNNFEKLVKLRGSLRMNAKTIFKWSDNEYYYFFCLDEIQKFILDNRYKYIGKKYNYDESFKQKISHGISLTNGMGINISKKSIVEITKLSSEALDKGDIKEAISKDKLRKKQLMEMEIVKKIDSFLRSKRCTYGKVTNNEIYKYIGKSYKWLKQNFPELLKLIKKNVDKINKEFEVEQVNAINHSADKFYSSGKRITYKTIAGELAISESKLIYYPVLKDAVLEARRRYGLK